MDPVTHTLIGIGLGNGLFRKQLGAAAVPVLALASNLPDVDAALHLMGDPAILPLRRTFGHSVFTLPLWALVLALILGRFFPRLRLPLLFASCLAGASVHVFFDLVNSFGVVILWPFSDWRPELAILFIIDLILTGLLAAPLLLCVVRRARPHLPRLSRLSLVAVMAYVLFCGASRTLAGRALATESAGLSVQQAPAGGAPPEFVYVFPEPLGPHRWRGVVRRGDSYRVYLIHSLSGSVELKYEVKTAADDPRVRTARRTTLGRRLERFFKAPVWTVRSAPGEVTVHDLRFHSIVLERDPVFLYRFRIDPDGRAEPLR